MDSVIIVGGLMVTVVFAVCYAVYLFIADDGGVGGADNSGYRYNFSEHQNYWNEDK